MLSGRNFQPPSGFRWIVSKSPSLITKARRLGIPAFEDQTRRVMFDAEAFLLGGRPRASGYPES